MKKKQKDVKLEFVITHTLYARNGLGMIKQTCGTELSPQASQNSHLSHNSATKA